MGSGDGAAPTNAAHTATTIAPSTMRELCPALANKIYFN